MVLMSVYLFNFFCAIVPCSVTQPPPEAFISDGNFGATQRPIPVSVLVRNETLSEAESMKQASISGISSRDGFNLKQDQESSSDLNFDFPADDLKLDSRSKRLLDRGLESNSNSNRNSNYGDTRPKIGKVSKTPMTKAHRRRSYYSSKYGGSRNLQSYQNPQNSQNHQPQNFQRRSRMTTTNSNSNSNLNTNPNSGLTSVIPRLFSALPIVPVILNNFNNIMRTMNTNMNNQNQQGSRGGRQAFGNYEAPVAQTEYGSIEGYFMGTMRGRKISAFEGVPFAEPPLGKYRFKSPVPKFPWKNTLQAKKPGSNCLQAHPLDFFRVTGAEDCLYLNVYTPQMPANEDLQLLPVVFLIHGGSFQYGSGSEYGPAYLLDENIILVTANYRLGPLGFMSTGDSESPGNYGLKDQALALKWVHDNIEQFGGDKSKVTIMGQSAGAVSAHLHLTSNKTTQYFQNGVSLSGSAFGFWPIVGRERAIKQTQRLASVLNCPRSSNAEIVRCLRYANAHWITAAQMQLYEWIPFHPLVLFAPTIEPEGPDAFLTRRPEEAYEKNEVMNKTWIFGQTSQEGHFDIYFMKLMMQTTSIALNGRKYLPIILDYAHKTRQPRTSDVTDKILKFYGGALIGRGIDINAISQMYTDRIYTSTVRKAIKAHSAIAPTYAYVFDYKGKYNLGSLFGIQESDWGVAHTEDMFYYFNSSVYHHGLQKNDPECGLSQIMTDVLSNFATTGVPMHKNSEDAEVTFWDPVVSTNETSSGPLQYLRIAKDISMIPDPFERRIAFWESLFLD